MKRGTLLCLCLLLSLPTAPALAKKKHKRKPITLGPVVTVTTTGNLTTNGGDESTAVATCPSGKQVIGGGYSAPFTSAQAFLFVHDSFRSSDQSWTVAARDVSGIGPGGAATAYAYCRNFTKSPVSDSMQSTALTEFSQTGTTSASCPSGTQLVGGGFQSTVGPDEPNVVFIQQNFPAAGAWTVTGVNNRLDTQTLTAHAYCLAGIRAPVIVSGSSSGSFGEDQSVVATTPACPGQPKPKKRKKGKKKRKKKPAQLLSAGGFNGPVGGVSGPFPIWTDTLVELPGWTVAATNMDSAGSATITSYGVCV